MQAQCVMRVGYARPSVMVIPSLSSSRSVRGCKDIAVRGKLDGNGLTIRGHRICGSFARFTDGLADITEGSTAMTVTNFYFTEYDKVMLLGRSDDFLANAGMQISCIGFNDFTKGLLERMLRCRHGESATVPLGETTLQNHRCEPHFFTPKIPLHKYH
ncbi:pectin lyase fold/virulence factor, AmbAllergen [Artemisia annua]|uniref:Pectin lyase fold/virulence factor, AmbAllergen n=1 Tax=Artemisia annua TaxID=35608 RepID=A0A2U1NGM4_ARTAN|nr:pectin lyase fold/virulence factor, AmbAllergen [Artemisia annua]